jgi:sec-independent protein translocase protein TatB
VFDIGFAELLLIGVVGLLVVGPDQLPGAVRTTLAWVNRFRRSFDQIRTEVRRELHNDEIMQKLKAESQEFEQQVRHTTQSIEHELKGFAEDAPPASSSQPAPHHQDVPANTSPNADTPDSTSKSV